MKALLNLLQTMLLLAAMMANSPAHSESPAHLEAIPLLPAVPATRLEAGTQGEIVFDSKSPFDFDILLNHYGRLPVTSTIGHLYLPESASAESPAPAVVLLPGSGGVKLGRQMLYADALVSNGFAVIVVDYYASRNVDDDKVPYTIMVSNVTEFDVVTDAYSALKALNKHPAIDPERVGVIGFSYGGMATRLSLDSRLKKILAPKIPGFAAHVDFYGPCFQEFNTKSTTGAPLLTLRGANDGSVDLVACAVQEEKLRAAGSEVSSRIYATAGHAWGNLGPRYVNDANYLRGCQMVFDEQGFPSVNGSALIQSTDAIDRNTRYKMRLSSGRFFEGCLKNGYIVGRDEAVHQATLNEMLDFLKLKL